MRGLRSAEKRLKAFGASVQSIGTKIFGLGAAAIAPLLATTNVFAELGDQLAKMSARTGISVESLSELGYAAEQSGADMETLEGGVRKLQKFLVAVAEGSDSALSVLSSLGLTLADLSRLTPDKQFEFILRPKLCLGRNIPEALLRRVPNDSDIGDDQFVRE